MLIVAVACCAIHAPIEGAAAEAASVRQPVRIPVTQWILYEPCEHRECSAKEREWFSQRVGGDVSRANEVLISHRAGIVLDQKPPIRVRQVSSNEEVLNAGCRDAAVLRRLAGHAPGTLNVYYLRKPGARGFWCPPDTILLAEHAYPLTLAHEVGHAFGLVHLDSENPALRNNLMNSRGRMTELTPQQVLDINFSPGSFVNVYRFRPEESAP